MFRCSFLKDCHLQGEGGLERRKEIMEATTTITQVSSKQDADWKQGQFRETHRSRSLIRCEESPGLAAGFVLVP